MNRTFDPDTLLAQSSSVAGSYDSTYAYDDEGRIVSVSVGAEDQPDHARRRDCLHL